MLLSPLPARGMLDSGKLKLGFKSITAGQLKLTCVDAVPNGKDKGGLQTNSSTPRYYCFDPSTNALRVSYSDSITAEFNHIAKTQGRYLAMAVDVLAGKRKAISISVTTIDWLDPSDAALSPALDAIVMRAPLIQPISGELGDNVTKGALVKKMPPIYPAAAKMAGVQGVVVLGAVIGTDGKVGDLEVLISPSPMLAKSALDTVKTWEYTPYLLDGKAVEVETTINVIFSLSR